MVLFISFLIENKNKTDRASLCVIQYVPTYLLNSLKAFHSAYKCVEFYKINWLFNLEKGQRRQKIGLKNNFIIQGKNNLHNTTSSRILRHKFLNFYRNFQRACPPHRAMFFSCSLFPSKFQRVSVFLICDNFYIIENYTLRTTKWFFLSQWCVNKK